MLLTGAILGVGPRTISAVLSGACPRIHPSGDTKSPACPNVKSTALASEVASLTLIMCDLESFKAINDAEDALLQGFAHLLLSMTHDGIDTVVRYGGGEFLRILLGTNLADGYVIAERMRARLARASSLHGHIGLAPPQVLV